MSSIFILLFLLSFFALIIGLIKPSVFKIILGPTPKRKIIALICIGAMFLFFIAVGMTASPNEQSEQGKILVNNNAPLAKELSNNKKEEAPAVEEETNKPVAISPGTSLPQPTPQPEVTEPAGDLYSVSSVVDGDTIKVNIAGTVTTIRIIGINTPEVVDPRKPVQCFGVEASNKAKELLTGAKVSLETDLTQGDKDIYGRSLRYVFTSDGTDFGKLMIAEGYAFEYTYNLPYKYQTEYKAAETYARENNLGLWSPDTCNGVASPVSTGSGTNTNTNTNAGAPEGCVIKGNISSSKEKIYHLPGCEDYDKTVINESAGERWFCTEEEAVAAGWRKAKNCP
jgi:micrococcal nuclease